MEIEYLEKMIGKTVLFKLPEGDHAHRITHISVVRPYFYVYGNVVSTNIKPVPGSFAPLTIRPGIEYKILSKKDFPLLIGHKHKKPLLERLLKGEIDDMILIDTDTVMEG